MHGLMAHHIRSAVKNPGWLEIMIETEHLKFQVLTQGSLFLAVDCHVGRIVEGDDPMYLALNHFVVRNNPRIKELMA